MFLLVGFVLYAPDRLVLNLSTKALPIASCGWQIMCSQKKHSLENSSPSYLSFRKNNKKKTKKPSNSSEKRRQKAQ